MPSKKGVLMRYSDEELFDMTKEEWDDLLNTDMKPKNFFMLCIERLKDLVEQSVDCSDWMETEKNHLRNYRMKSIRFYERKIGL